jgi:hypothetical protein
MPMLLLNRRSLDVQRAADPSWLAPCPAETASHSKYLT